MLDVSVRASVLNLMKDVSKKMGLTTVYISHDLSLIEYMCDEVDIMYLGTIVEKGVTKSVLNNPVHPYTKALMAASLSVDPTAKKDEIKINNSISDPVNLPDGCIFQDRCPYVMEKCRDKAPQYVKVADDHYVACYLADQDNS